MNTRVLDPASADRLAKILGLCGSRHDGERAAAAKMANDLVRGLGLTWRQIISPPLAPREPPQPHRSDDDGEGVPSWRVQLRKCLGAIDELGDRDADFISTLSRWGGTPSPKQRAWLADIYRRIAT